jgi:hypothetical protein
MDNYCISRIIPVRKIIAIMDAGYPGVNTTQPFQRLKDNDQILGGYNFVLRDSNLLYRFFTWNICTFHN